MIKGTVQSRSNFTRTWIAMIELPIYFHETELTETLIAFPSQLPT